MKSAEEYAAMYRSGDVLHPVIRAAQAEAFAAGAEAMRKASAAACAGTYAKTAFEFELGTACQQAILSLPVPKMEDLQ